MENSFKKIVKAEDRISLPILTKYEMAKIIGLRATQIAINTNIILVPFSKNKFDPLVIAEEELKKGLLNYRINRSMPDGRIETWELKELYNFN